MTVRGMNLIECDECGLQVAKPSETIHSGPAQQPDVATRQWMTRWGWTVDSGGRDLCMDCSQ